MRARFTYDDAKRIRREHPDATWEKMAAIVRREREAPRFVPARPPEAPPHRVTIHDDTLRARRCR